MDIGNATYLSLAPSSYFHPAPELAGCVRIIVGRNTLGWNLDEAERHNHLPTLVTCCLTWMIEGGIQIKTKGYRRAVASMVCSGPQTLPSVTVNLGPAHMLGVMIYPDAFHRMTGIHPGELVNKTVPMQDIFSQEWMLWAQAVMLAPNDVERVECIQEFLMQRWMQCKNKPQRIGATFQDWIHFLEKQMASQSQHISQRQVERWIKRWTGQNLRGLQGVARAEQAFFYAFKGLLRGELNWRDVALQSGYSDQSHLCRETRRFSGFSPDELKNGMLQQESFWIYRLWMNGF